MSAATAALDDSSTDHGLVVRARCDRDAFGVLYDQYYPRVLRYCLRRLFVREAAEDVTSDVFLHVAAHLPGFAGKTEADFRRWVFRIAVNAVNAQLRQTQRRHQLLEAAARCRRLPAADGAPPPFETLDWPVAYQAILELPDRDQAILTLRFFAGLSHDEIAAVVGASAAAVRTALSRVLQRLRIRFGVDESSNALSKGQS